jgi:hypothetical protein
MTGFTTENDMQREIGDLVRTGRLANCIVSGDELHGLLDESPNVLPLFSIDRLSRIAMVRAALGCTEDIHDIQILTDDQNVSMRRGEALRPDFVGISETSRSVWIIELKNSGQTAREAFTELLGYEHEVKNYLPFLADWDINFVLISSEWSTLLDHSLASACTWSRKKVLGLEAKKALDGSVTLKVRIPESWTITGVAHFPSTSLPCFQISLDGTGEGTPEEPDPRLLIAMNLLAREGDRQGGHGFAMLWRDRGYGDKGQFHLTLCGVSPSAFFKAAKEIGTISDDQGKLAVALSASLLGEIDPTPNALLSLYTYIKPVVAEVGKPKIEGFMDWLQAQETYLHRAEPIYMEFWGMLGDHARRYVMHPAIRETRPDLLGNGMQDWRSPSVGLQILDELFAPTFCVGGEIRMIDAFTLGRDLAIDAVLRQNLDSPSLKPEMERALSPRRFWHSIRMQILLEQARLIYMSSSTISDVDTPVRYSLGTAPYSEENFLSLGQWIRTGFLANSDPHVTAFNLGFRGNVAFDPALSTGGSGVRKLLSELEPEIKEVRQAAFDCSEKQKHDGGLSSRQDILVAELKALKEPNASMVEKALELLDTLIFPVFHKLNPIAEVSPDWSWLKQGVREARARGQRAAIRLGADGTFGTTVLTEPHFLLMSDIDDPEADVLFLNHRSGFATLTKTTWVALEASKDFENLPPP